MKISQITPAAAVDRSMLIPVAIGGDNRTITPGQILDEAAAEAQKGIDKNAALLAEANIRVFDRIILNRTLILLPPIEPGEIVYSAEDNAFYRYQEQISLGGSSSKGYYWPLSEYMDGDAPSAALLYRRRSDSMLYRYDAATASLAAFGMASDISALAERVDTAEAGIAALKTPSGRERQNAILGWDEDDRAYYAARADDLAAFRADIAYAVDQYEATKGKTASRYENDTTLVYAPQIRDLDSTAASWTASNAFHGCTGLRRAGNIDFAGCTGAFGVFRASGVVHCVNLILPDAVAIGSMFNSCPGLENAPHVNAPKCTDARTLFQNCSALKSMRGDVWDFPVLTNALGLFYNCEELTDIPRLVTPRLENAASMFYNCRRLERIAYVDFQSVTSGASFAQCFALDILNIDHLGAVEEMTEPATLDLHWSSHLGESEEGREALVCTLLTNSHDRAAEGWEPLTVTLHANALARLTADEIAAITAKGFTLTTS